jgi:predicted phosphodiesterase
MGQPIPRSEFLQILGVGGLVFASGLPGFGAPAKSKRSKSTKDFYFVQLSDTHWGFEGAKVNPDARGTLAKAIGVVNALDPQPDFVIFTGDLTHTTDDGDQRRKRLGEFKDLASGLHCPQVYFLPGEHDASLDEGAAYRERFGPTHYAFEHKGIRFLALDNVSQTGSTLGEPQLKWFADELRKIPRTTPLVIFAHRPLFDLYPEWDWHTTDGQRALDLLKDYPFVTVFYGHIHQEHHHSTGQIQHHAATSLIFPLPAPGSMPKRAPLPWDPDHPYRGLGLRQIHTLTAGSKALRQEITEIALAQALATLKAPA